ncbi:MAG: DUF4382 domain-containing protein [Spongiibacteraceae bacterium]|nr:DUF4382 domain-containing protein [Spongiibacteraceae bacterium]
MRLETFFFKSAIVLLTLGLFACGGGSSDSAGSTGTVSFSVTDAPVDSANMVLVQFTSVTVKPSNGDAETLPLGGSSQSCLNLLDGIDPSPSPEGESSVRCIELKALRGTQSASLLSGVALSRGTYDWVRLDVEARRDRMDSIIVLNDASRESLYIPSGSESGLKLNTGFTILAGGTHNFVIDFDLRKSVNNPQGFSDYRLRPSLRLIDLSESGNIVGTVDAALLTDSGCTGDVNTGDGFAVYVYEGGAETRVGEEGSLNAPLTSAGLRLNDETAQWQYSVGFVAPGDYTVVFTCQAAEDSAQFANDDISFVDSVDSPATVVVAQDSVVNFTF